MEVELKKRLVSLLYIFSICFIAFSLNVSVAYPYSVTLSWNAPTKDADGTTLKDLAGYYVYRGIQSRHYGKKIKVAGDITEYTFTTLKKDVTYYFAVTAYDTSGNESGYSNEASMTQYGLTVIKSVTGSGNVTSSPAGITCGTDCHGRYRAGSIVTLTARPKDGSTFTGWSGGQCSGNGQCILTMNSPTTVTANFAD